MTHISVFSLEILNLSFGKFKSSARVFCFTFKNFFCTLILSLADQDKHWYGNRLIRTVTFRSLGKKYSNINKCHRVSHQCAGVHKSLTSVDPLIWSNLLPCNLILIGHSLQIRSQVRPDW